jgi:predicted nucleic acid-binding protein
VAVSPAVATVGAGQRVLVDTNILVFASSKSAPRHLAARAALDTLAQAGVELWISRQVLREYMATMTRPQTFAGPVPMAMVLADVGRFVGSLFLAEDGPPVFAQLLAILSTVPCGGRQVHDANIVATMLAHAIPNLLTDNTADFARYSSLITLIPLVP